MVRAVVARHVTTPSGGTVTGGNSAGGYLIIYEYAY